MLMIEVITMARIPNPFFGSPEMVAKARESREKHKIEKQELITALGGVDSMGFVSLHGVSVPAQYVMLFQKVFAGKGTVAECIKAKCIDCIYDPEYPGYAVEQIESCSAKYCGLYHHRPHRK